MEVIIIKWAAIISFENILYHLYPWNKWKLVNFLIHFMSLCANTWQDNLKGWKAPLGSESQRFQSIMMGRVWHDHWGSREELCTSLREDDREQEAVATDEHSKDTHASRRPHLPKFLGPPRIGLPFEDQTSTIGSFGEVSDSNFNRDKTKQK